MLSSLEFSLGSSIKHRLFSVFLCQKNIHMNVIHKYKAIWNVVAHIREGDIATYGEVAKRAGLVRQARLVSKALKEAPDSLNLPWFRVVGSGPKVSLPLDSESGKKQVQFLQKEGHEIVKGRIKLTNKSLQEGIENSDSNAIASEMDYLLWGPEN